MFDELKNLGKHSFIYMLGSVASRMVGFVMIPVYTRYLTPADYGVLELVSLTVDIVGMFAALGMHSAITRFYFDYKEQRDRDEVITTALVSILILASIPTGILIYKADFLSTVVFGGPQYGFFFQLLLASNLLDMFVIVPMTVLTIRERSRTYVGFSLLRLALSLSLNIFFVVVLQYGIAGILYSSLISISLSTMLLSIVVLRRFKLRFSIVKALQMLRFGSPLVLASVGTFILNFADRYFLEHFWGVAAVGVYAVGYKFALGLSELLHRPFTLMWNVFMFKIADREDAREMYARVMTYNSFVVIFAALGMAVLIEDVLRIVVDTRFVDAHKIVPLVLSGFYFYYMMPILDVGIMLTKKTYFRAMNVTIAAIVNLALNYLLISRFEMMGAAAATFLSYFFLSTLTLFVSGRLYRIRYEYIRLGKMYITALAIFGVSRFIAFDSLIVSAGAKALLALMFPAILFLVGFFDHKERRKIAELLAAVRGKLRDR